MERLIGTISRGVRAPIIKQGNALIDAPHSHNGQNNANKHHDKAVEDCSLKIKFFCFHNRNR